MSIRLRCATDVEKFLPSRYAYNGATLAPAAHSKQTVTGQPHTLNPQVPFCMRALAVSTMRSCAEQESVMRYLPTSPEKVEAFKKQAKRLQRKSGGKHAELLNLVARQAGYDHWHHVTRCLDAASRKTLSEILLSNCSEVVRSARAGKSVFLANRDALKGTPLVIFSTHDGDAWLLELENDMALCLSWHGQTFEAAIQENATQIHIGWDGRFELRGSFFEVRTTHSEIGHRAIAGYPVDALRDFLDKVMSEKQKYDQLVRQNATVDVTPDILESFVARGLEREMLARYIEAGARYSPHRDSIVLPSTASSDSFKTDADGQSTAEWAALVKRSRELDL